MTTLPDLRPAASWRLRRLLLERPRPGWSREVLALAHELGDAALGEAARAAAQGTEGTYLALMGPGGAIPAREVAYRDREDPARVLAALAACYDAFAYRPRSEEPADHIAVEAGFVGYLMLKEAIARAAGDAERARIAAEAVARFREEHVDAFAAELARRLAGAGGYLDAAARELLGAVTTQQAA